MKKFLASILTLALCLGLATGCAGKQTPAENDTESAGETGVKEIPSLKIAFSPYADADQITTATEPLEQLLQAKLLEKGYDVKDIDMTVGTSYTAVGEALSAGSAAAADHGRQIGGRHAHLRSGGINIRQRLCQVLILFQGLFNERRQHGVIETFPPVRMQGYGAQIHLAPLRGHVHLGPFVLRRERAGPQQETQGGDQRRTAPFGGQGRSCQPHM